VSRPDRPDRPRALALRALGLGDLLAGVPALTALRRALPDHDIALAAPAPLAPLVRLIPAVDRQVAAAELAPVPWTGPPPAVAVDLHGNGPASRDLLRALSPGRLVGFAGPLLAREDGPRWHDDEPERLRWVRLVTTVLGGPGADADDVAIDRPAAPSRHRGAVVVHPGAAYPARRWPPERFAAVARSLAELSEVVVTGGPSERPLAAAVAAGAGLPPEAVACDLDLDELAALVADAGLVVCGDTGVAHLASAYGTPSVLLFGPTPPALWGPPARPQHIVLWHVTGRGDPWAAVPDPALLRITVAEVVAAAERLLVRPLTAS
jgi:ADP-heptose:LPS heptosyltransferase